MARTDSRGGPLTRNRIAQIASAMFAERGFEAVTVADIAERAGVSTVTVFKHFPKKEDLFLDRAGEAAELLHAAVRDRAASGGIAGALRHLVQRLIDDRHPFSGLDARSVTFFRTVANSPTLIARARQIAAELENVLSAELAAAPDINGDTDLLAAFFIAGYARVLTGTAGDLIDGASPSALTQRHRKRVQRLFTGLEKGVLESSSATAATAASPA